MNANDMNVIASIVYVVLSLHMVVFMAVPWIEVFKGRGDRYRVVTFSSVGLLFLLGLVLHGSYFDALTWLS